MQKKRVSILALKNANYASIVDSRAVFEKANELLQAAIQKRVISAIQIIAEESELTIERGLITIRPDATVADNVESRPDYHSCIAGRFAQFKSSQQIFCRLDH